MAKKPKANCNSCKHGELNTGAPLPFGPRGTQIYEIECMSPKERLVRRWADDNLQEGWCAKGADGCPGYAAAATP